MSILNVSHFQCNLMKFLLSNSYFVSVGHPIPVNYKRAWLFDPCWYRRGEKRTYCRDHRLFSPIRYIETDGAGWKVNPHGCWQWSAYHHSTSTLQSQIHKCDGKIFYDSTKQMDFNLVVTRKCLSLFTSTLRSQICKCMGNLRYDSSEANELRLKM